MDRARRALAGHRATAIDFEAGMIPAAVAIVLREVEDGKDLEALFIHRAERVGDVWSGHVAFPGGRRDPGDADLLATAIRETHEEIGINLLAAERLGVLDDLYPRTPVLPPVMVRPFVFALTELPELTLSDEVQGAFWVRLGALAEPAVRSEIKVDHPGITPRVLPAYKHGKHTIWGMSERILTPLISLIS